MGHQAARPHESMPLRLEIVARMPAPRTPALGRPGSLTGARRSALGVVLPAYGVDGDRTGPAGTCFELHSELIQGGSRVRGYRHADFVPGARRERTNRAPGAGECPATVAPVQHVRLHRR